MFHYPPTRVEVPFDYLLLTISIQLPIYAIVLFFVEPLLAHVPSYVRPFLAREVLLIRPGAVPRPLSGVGCPGLMGLGRED